MSKSLSIVIPAYNEERIHGSVLEILEFAGKNEQLNAGIIVVDDGSSDKTVEVAENVCEKFPANVNALCDSRRMFNEVRQIRRNAKFSVYKEENSTEKITEFVEAVN